MTNIILLQQSNLSQAFQMSLYSWALAIGLGLLLWLIGNYLLKTTIQRMNMYTVSAIFIGVFAAVTSIMWIYYFNVFVSLPFFVLLLFLTFQLVRMDNKSTGAKVAKGLVIATIVLAGLSGMFLGVFS